LDFQQQAEEAEASSITLHMQERQVAVAEDPEAVTEVLQAEDQVINLPYLHHKDKMVEQEQEETETALEEAEAERLTQDNLHLTTELQEQEETE
jgi:hypothetical protein